MKRFQRVQHFIETKGLRVGAGTWEPGPNSEYEAHPTVDVDDPRRPEINGGWYPYGRGDERDLSSGVSSCS